MESEIIKKKHKRNIIILCLVFIVLLFIVGRLAWLDGHNTSDIVTNTGTKMVYITPTGTKYHRRGCSTIKDKQITISLEEARSGGYSACSKCKP